MLSALFQPTTPLPSNIQRIEIPSGHAGTAATIQHMSRLALTATRDPAFRRFAISIIKGNEGVPAAKDRDFRQYVDRLYQWVKKKMYFIHDPVDVERVENPIVLLKEGGGDCDSVSTLLAGLLMSAGFKTDFVTIKAEPSSDEWTHVYVQTTLPDGKVIPLDCTMKTKYSGWEPKNFPRQVWPISKQDPQSSDAGSPDSVPMPTDTADAGDQLFGMGSTPWAPEFGMQGLGETAQEVTLAKVLDGSMANELSALRTKLNEQTGSVFNLKTAADKIADPAKRAQAIKLADAAQDALNKQKQITNEAIAKYNSVAGDIQTYSLQVLKPRQLGALPQAAVAILGVAAIAIALNALATLVGAARGQSNATEGYISQAARFMQAAGVAVEQGANASIKYGVVALVGVALYIGITMLKKRGKI